MDTAALREYAQSRDYSNKAFRAGCYAPFVSLQFNPYGIVKVCCQNYYHPVGNIPEQSIAEIWNGPRIQQLRQALRRFNFDTGCEFCKWEILEGNHAHTYARNYDPYAVPPAEEARPQVMEFLLYNTCNLECVQCDEFFSSAIRQRRAKLPPLPRVYGDAFFAELRAYLPHLAYALIAGGEPFLVRENYRIWDLMIADDLKVLCYIMTNGTIYNERVERVLEALPCQLAISMDGCTKKTVESIRVHAKFEVLMENFRKFHAHAARRGAPLLLNFCLMRQNWHEFGDFLLFAEEHDCRVDIQPVVSPAEFSLFTLPPEELRAVVASLERQGDRVLPRLRHNAAAWTSEVARLRHRLDQPFTADFHKPAELVQLGHIT